MHNNSFPFFLLSSFLRFFAIKCITMKLNIIPKIPKIPNQVTELRFPSLGSVVSCKKCALESLS